MKKHPTKIILNLFLTILVTACHSLEHNGFKLNPTNKNIVKMEMKANNSFNFLSFIGDISKTIQQL